MIDVISYLLGKNAGGGGGGDSRFSTCEVEIFFTKNGQPLTLNTADLSLFNGYSANPITATDDMIDAYYKCSAMLDQDNTIVTPLLFEGIAYSDGVAGMSGDTYYVMNYEVAPVCTGDISIGTFGDLPIIIIRGDGTITFEMMED